MSSNYSIQKIGSCVRLEGYNALALDALLFALCIRIANLEATKLTTSGCGVRKADLVKTVEQRYHGIFVPQMHYSFDFPHLVVILHLHLENPLVQASQTQAALQVFHSQHCGHKNTTLQQMACQAHLMSPR